MTIDEAIKEGEKAPSILRAVGQYKTAEAVQLGIEALQFLKRWRDNAEIQPYPLLPSETTD